MGTLFLIFLVFYFLPTLVAVSRGKRNKGSIFVLNLFLGWSLIGWVIALVWAMTHDGVVVLQQSQQSNGTVAELQQLEELKNRNAITSEEYEAAKKKLLGIQTPESSKQVSSV